MLDKDVVYLVGVEAVDFETINRFVFLVSIDAEQSHRLVFTINLVLERIGQYDGIERRAEHKYASPVGDRGCETHIEILDK